MQLNDKFLLALFYAHGDAVIARIEQEAEHNARLRWLLGGVHFAPATIDRIEREARANARFRDLLGGVWYYRASDELKLRLDALVGQDRW